MLSFRLRALAESCDEAGAPTLAATGFVIKKSADEFHPRKPFETKFSVSFDQLSRRSEIHLTSKESKVKVKIFSCEHSDQHSQTL